jgi:hypothetical protein
MGSLPLGGASLRQRLAVNCKDKVWADKGADSAAGAASSGFVELHRAIPALVVAGREVKDMLRAGLDAQLAAFAAFRVDVDGSSCHDALL